MISKYLKSIGVDLDVGVDFVLVAMTMMTYDENVERDDFFMMMKRKRKGRRS